MREKMIELLNKVQDYGIKNIYEEHYIIVESKDNETIADFLIANGVIIPVRCKECEHWKDIDNIGCSDLAKVCMLSNYMIVANGYCLYGERSADDNN